MVRLISRQRGGLAALKLTKLFGIDDFPPAKDAGKVLIIIIYCYLIIIILEQIGVGLLCNIKLIHNKLNTPTSVSTFSVKVKKVLPLNPVRVRTFTNISYFSRRNKLQYLQGGFKQIIVTLSLTQ